MFVIAHRFRRAVSLMELTVVIVVVSLLAAVAVIGVSQVSKKASVKAIESTAASFGREVEILAQRRGVETLRSAALVWSVAAANDLPRGVSVATEGAAAGSVVLLQRSDGKPGSVVTSSTQISPTPVYVSFAKGTSSVCLRLEAAPKSGWALVGSDDSGFSACDNIKLDPVPSGAAVQAWSTALNAGVASP